MANTSKQIPKELSKQQLLQKIHAAKQSISIIGATVFDLDWDDILDANSNDGLAWKFFNIDNFTIRILRESENLIAQYALLSEGVADEDESSFSSGNLNSVKTRIVSSLKKGLVEYAKKTGRGQVGIEPPEDVFKKELKENSDKFIRRKVLDEIERQSLFEKLLIYIKEEIRVYIDKQVDYCAEIITEQAGWSVTRTEYMPKIEKIALKLFETLSINLFPDRLIAMDFYDVYKDMGYENEEIIVEYKKKNGKIEKIKFAKDLKVKMHSALLSFRLTNADDANEEEKKELEKKNIIISSAKEAAEKSAAQINAKDIKEYASRTETKQRLFIKDCYMPIPVPLIEIDDELFITQALTKFDTIDKFQYVGDIDSPDWEDKTNDSYRSYWIREFKTYYKKYFDDSLANGVQKYSTEETNKGDRKEVIDIFNESRVRIGSGPRDSFLSNMSIVKSVVWAFIFDRRGNVLIHQRSVNAKDNRGLWDKSVGGHVSVADLDTVEAIRREITEELYTIEDEGQGGHDKVQWLLTNKDKIIYLGDWRVNRYPDFKGLHLEDDEYYAFSLNYSNINEKNFRKTVIMTERLLPGGMTVKAKCFVDPYLCIVAKDFDIKKLENSKYAMLTPNELKTCVSTGKIRLDPVTRYYDRTAEPMGFKPTSDLEFIVNDSIWGEIVTEFSKRIKENFKND